MLWGIGFAVWMVIAFIRELKHSPSFSDDFRTLKSRSETFRVDWAENRPFKAPAGSRLPGGPDTGHQRFPAPRMGFDGVRVRNPFRTGVAEELAGYATRPRPAPRINPRHRGRGRPKRRVAGAS